MQIANSGNSASSSENSSALVMMFTDACIEIFNHRKNIELEKKDADYKAIHRSMSNLIRMHISQEQTFAFNTNMKEVIYIITVMADEIFLNIEWDGKKFWEENMLEQQFFNTQIAGEIIFQKIEDLLEKNDPALMEKAEVYLKVLALGFRGKFRGSTDEQIEINSYRNKLFDFIGKKDSTIILPSFRLFQRDYTYTIPTISRKMLPDAEIVNYVSLFFVFMFFVISSVVWIFETRDIKLLLLEISKIALRE